MAKVKILFNKMQAPETIKKVLFNFGFFVGILVIINALLTVIIKFI